MKVRRLATAVALILMATLMVAAPATAAGPVYHFQARITYLNDPGAGTKTPLPGGRTLLTGGTLTICYEATEVDPEHDYISGCWYCTYSEIIQPSGALSTWGSCPMQDLVNYDGAGGWVHQFRGEWSPNATLISLHNTAQGWGDLAGWRMQWREIAHRFDLVGRVTDFGFFQAP